MDIYNVIFNKGLLLFVATRPFILKLTLTVFDMHKNVDICKKAVNIFTIS